MAAVADTGMRTRGRTVCRPTIRAALTQTQFSVPIAEGRPTLVTWQGVYLYEHRTSPHRRELVPHLLARLHGIRGLAVTETAVVALSSRGFASRRSSAPALPAGNPRHPRRHPSDVAGGPGGRDCGHAGQASPGSCCAKCGRGSGTARCRTRPVRFRHRVGRSTSRPDSSAQERRCCR
ncbi:YjbQ family protein [Humitalea rosea]